MRWSSGNVIHVRHNGIVHCALLSETVPLDFVRFLCELHLDLQSRYRLLFSPLLQVTVDVDCMACCAKGCLQ